MISVNKVAAESVGVEPSAISANALKVVQEIQEAGFEAYLVGGCVRDLILGRKPKDFDVATNATPEQIKPLFRNSRIIGRRFKLVHVRFGYDVIEVATFRADASDRDMVSANEMSEGEQGQLLRDNIYGTIEEDVIRRDFRANALYYDPQAGEILDFVGGIEDIKNKKMISIGEPKQRFREDPVRMLRVIRFAAKLGFSIEPEAMEIIEGEAKLLAHVSSARLFEEVLKLFHGGAAYETFMLLRKYGLFKYLFPFTDQTLVDDAQGMPEMALKNTDKRIDAGKPVIPAFLFACMLWEPVRADAQVLMQDGTPESQAWRIAMTDALRDQNQYVAVPRRLAEIILDIWNIHFRLIKRNPRMVKTSLNNRRFRAAYDFLLLRVALHEVDAEIGKWWTDVQEVDAAEREEMIAEISETYKDSRKRQREGNVEANGNSIDYSPKANGNRERRNQNNAANRGRRDHKHSSHSHRRGNGNGFTPEGGQANPRGRRYAKKRAPNSNSQNMKQGNADYPYDSYTGQANAEQPNKKKVKVRHKRRIGNISNNESPHF